MFPATSSKTTLIDMDMISEFRNLLKLKLQFDYEIYIEGNINIDVQYNGVWDNYVHFQSEITKNRGSNYTIIGQNYKIALGDFCTDEPIIRKFAYLKLEL